MIRLTSIRVKLLAIFVIAAVLPITLLSLISYHNSMRAIETMVGNRTDRLARSVQEEVDENLSRRLSDDLLVVNQPVQDYLEAAGKGQPAEENRLYELRRYLSSLFEQYGDYYDRLLLADAQGKPLVTYGREEGLASLMAKSEAREIVEAAREAAREVARIRSMIQTTGDVPPVTITSIPFPGLLPVPPAAPYSSRDQAALRSGASLGPGEHRLEVTPASSGRPPVVSILRPVYSIREPARRLGLLLTRLRPNYLLPEDLGSRHFGQRGAMAIVNAETGEIIYHTRGEMVRQDLGQVDPPLFAALRGPIPDPQGGSHWRRLAGPDGPRLASIFKLSNVPWAVVATALPSEFTAETRQAGLLNLLVSSLALLLAAGVLIVASGRITRSIHEVEAGARSIAAGDLDRTITVQTHDEIRTLADAFNAMTASLRHNISLRETAAAELDALNRSLENRVEERTRELTALNQALNQANEELKELDRLKSNFLATVSHEFKTPLTSIKAFAEIIHDEMEEQDVSEEMRRFIRIINSESDRLGRLIKNVLDLSRIESGRMVWRMSVFPVRQVIDTAVEGLLPVLAEKKIRLERDYGCNDSRIHADHDRIQEVIANILDNAVKASSEGQSILIGCRETAAGGNGQPRMAQISIRDQGCGIPEDQLESIFDRFAQVSSPHTRTRGGTGLGLAISREIVESHGGRIWAESRLGRGSTFYVSLPAGENVDATA